MGRHILCSMIVFSALALCVTACFASVKTAALQVSATVIADCSVSLSVHDDGSGKPQALASIRRDGCALHAITGETAPSTSHARGIRQIVAIAIVTF